MRSSSGARFAAAWAGSGGSRFSTTATTAPSEVGSGSATSLACKSATPFLIMGKSGIACDAEDPFCSSSSAREKGGNFSNFKFNFCAALATGSPALNASPKSCPTFAARVVSSSRSLLALSASIIFGFASSSVSGRAGVIPARCKM